MTTLKKAREQGKLEDFIAEHEKAAGAWHARLLRKISPLRNYQGKLTA